MGGYCHWCELLGRQLWGVWTEQGGSVQEANRGKACCGVQATEVVLKGKVFLGGVRHCHKVVY